MTVELTKCRHCYALIREAKIVDETPLFISDRVPAHTSAWLNAENRSPWCLRELCGDGHSIHELRHEPMPPV